MKPTARVFTKGRKVDGRASWIAPATVGLATFLALSAISYSSTPKTTRQADAATNKEDKIIVEDGRQLEKGRRGYVLLVEAGAGVLLETEPGARVDVISSFAAGPDGSPRTVTVVNGATVIKTDDKGNTVMLAVSPQEAEELAFAQANGRIFLSICPPGPDIALPGKGVSFEDM